MDAWQVAALVLGLWLLLGLLAQGGALRARHLAARAPPACFVRAPRPPAPGEPLNLCFLGDLQRGVASAVRPLGPALAAARCHLLVSSGDFVSHGEPPYYGILLAAFERADPGVAVRVVPGNHDLYPRRSKDERIGGPPFERCFGPRRWALRLGPALLVGLDTAGNRHFERQADWLDQTLAAHPEVPWICVSHRPPFRFDEPGEPPVPDLAALHARLRARPPLLHVSGHLHRFADRTVDGVRYVVNAHGGDLHGYDPGWRAFEVLEVEVGPDGRLGGVCRRAVRRRPDGRTYLDQFLVRLWDERRRWPWRAIAAPAGWLLRPLGLYVPVVRHPEQRPYPS